MKTNPANQALKKLLIILSKVTGEQFVEVSDGNICDIANGWVILKSLIDVRNGKHNIDGLYRLGKAVCSGDNCSIGHPNPKCVANGLYKKTECALYHLYDLSSINIEYDALLEIAKQYK